MSKRLIDLVECNLIKITPNTLPDGDIVDVETNIGTYKVTIQELNDNVSASIYGANITDMVRISSINGILEMLLKSKLNNTSDNISKYQILYDNTYYKIKNVKSKYIDIERV